MDAYVIIGEPNTRKSSVTRCLTGCYNNSVRNVLLNNGVQIQIYTHPSTLQESKTTAQAFIVEVNQHPCPCVIFGLWPNSNQRDPVQFPDASTYLTAFTEAGWNIVKVAVLGQDDAPALYPQQAFFPDSQTVPTNQTARDVRLHFEWQ